MIFSNVYASLILVGERAFLRLDGGVSLLRGDLQRVSVDQLELRDAGARAAVLRPKERPLPRHPPRVRAQTGRQYI